MSAPTSETTSGDNASGENETGAALQGASAEAPGRQAWTRQERPLRLERRLEFPDYEVTRVFLERSGALSEEMDIFPNLSFGRTYVNLTLFADDESGELTEQALTFAERVDRLLDAEPIAPS
ncbi:MULTISPECIES: 4a-hydroxytetrahydrobiopterin dehydratase [Thiorhodovibrio]|uniref:4a-hydroxytetrahydrobiopterin dehydratase n=1 Tax=Thiorhodovibrio TaxID=61593 RepID=UPI001911D4D1|nr:MULTISPECIES: 4a-hydroxytetrahydrobiopterin dehydratase [Thiorhodovibrio]MBK5968334.1 hypothetical protein [Thiorhodovibrio winogradskyi]WPL13217.1 pterin-4-alpha-carbinolamine dehydratase [Thiorhodovibrio litoralis]